MRLSAKIAPCLLVLSLLAIPAQAAGIALSPDAAQALDQIYNADTDAAVQPRAASSKRNRIAPWAISSKTKRSGGKCTAPRAKSNGACSTPGSAGSSRKTSPISHWRTKRFNWRTHKSPSRTPPKCTFTLRSVFALKARLYSLRDQKRDIAHAGVAARSECLRALQLDPDMADATATLGLYNYYVDTLSGIAKMLRFFMGIPGGNKEEGIRQMKIGMERGAFLAVDSRFYLAKNLRTYDRHYDEALEIAEPLATRYPRNPIFLLMLGNINMELGRNAKAAEYFRAAQSAPIPDPACAARIRDLANSLLATIH